MSLRTAPPAAGPQGLKRTEYNRTYKRARRELYPEFEKARGSNNSRLSTLRKKGLIVGTVDITTPNLMDIETALNCIKVLLKDNPEKLLETKNTIINSVNNL
jgi:hypothetical protein